MTKQTYDEQTITQYVLGSLPEEETLSFDELAVTDEDFVEALQVVEKDVVDAYVRGELSGQALGQFQSFYLASPRRRAKVEFARAFQIFAEKAVKEQGRTGAKDPTGSRRKFSGLISGLNLFLTPRLAFQWGLASAALILLLAGGWLAFENYRLRQQTDQAQAKRSELQQREQELQTQLAKERSGNAETEKELASVREELAHLKQQEQQSAVEQQRRAEEQRAKPQLPGGVSIASFILMPQMRGVGQAPTVSIPAKTDYVSMQLQLEPNDYRGYRVELLNPSNNHILWRSGNLRARATGESKILSVSFRAGLLRSETYLLRVSGVSARGPAEVISDYPFRVAR